MEQYTGTSEMQQSGIYYGTSVLIDNSSKSIDELEHHGILGMKWGVRRFQNPDGTRTALGKKRYRQNDASAERSSRERIRRSLHREKTPEELEAEKQKLINSGDLKKIYKNRSKLTTQELKTAIDRANAERQIRDALERDRQTRKKNAEDESAKLRADEADRLLKTGSAKEIYENRASLSNADIQNALNRLNNEKTLKSLTMADVKTGVDKLAELGEKAMKVRTASENFINLYNTVAKVNNSLFDTELPIIGEKKSKANAAIDSLVKSGDMTAILANKTKLTTQEFNDAYNRAIKERAMRKNLADDAAAKETAKANAETAKANAKANAEAARAAKAEADEAARNKAVDEATKNGGISAEEARYRSEIRAREEKVAREREKADKLIAQDKADYEARNKAREVVEETTRRNQEFDELREINTSAWEAVNSGYDYLRKNGYL